MTDDRHPEEHLAGYVDGSLSDKDRAVVESHLSGCARCRAESALAMRAVTALQEIQEVPVPVGVMSPVTGELSRRMAAARPRPFSQRVLWAAGGAIAAAFIGIVAIWVLPGIGGNNAGFGGASAPEAAAARGTSVGAAAGGGGAATAAPGRAAAVTIEHRSTNYDDAAIAKLATETAANAGATALGPATDEASQPSTTRTALGCVGRGAQVEPQAVLVRLISARFGGKPAYIAVYLTGPTTSQPPKSVLVVVVNADTCSAWNAKFTEARI
jgi:anti-sigma factor RsiW